MFANMIVTLCKEFCSNCVKYRGPIVCGDSPSCHNFENLRSSCCSIWYLYDTMFGLTSTPRRWLVPWTFISLSYTLGCRTPDQRKLIVTWIRAKRSDFVLTVTSHRTIARCRRQLWKAFTWYERVAWSIPDQTASDTRYFYESAKIVAENQIYRSVEYIFVLIEAKSGYVRLVHGQL